MAGGGGMDAVGLVEVGVAAHAGEKERDQGGMIFCRELWKDFAESPGVVRAEVGGNLHAGENDASCGITDAHTVDDALKVGARIGQRDATQAVVAAEFEDKNVHGPTQNPVDAPQPARTGLAAEPGVDHAPGQVGGVDFFLDESGKSLGGGIVETVAGGEAVAEENDGLRLRGAEDGETGQRGAQQQVQAETAKKHHWPFERFVVACFLIMTGQEMLKVERLTKTYPTAAGSLTVLHEVSFVLAEGASLAVVGPSGSGKTTLLGLCAGLDQPSAGTVELAGRALGPLSEDQRARVRNAQVGFVFQNFQLIPTLTALENVLVPLELAGVREGEGEARALLARVGLEERTDHYPAQLSGGEQQRVALARAFVNRPKILFCDEPTGNLDADTAGAMVELIFGLNRERKTTLVLVTHDIELARRCHRVIRLRGGAVVEDSGA